MADGNTLEYPTYRVVRAEKDPEVIRRDSRTYLSRAFTVHCEQEDSAPDVDDNIFRTLSIKYGLNMQRINTFEKGIMLGSVIIRGQSLESLGRLEASLDDLEFLLNADKHSDYADALIP